MGSVPGDTKLIRSRQTTINLVPHEKISEDLCYHKIQNIELILNNLIFDILLN